MKKLITIVVTLLPLLSISQSNQPITFTEVVKIDSADHTELFNRARSWFNTTFKSSKDVLNISDKETGELAGKGLTQFYSNSGLGASAVKGVLRFSITVQVKDGRYKYIITKFIHESNGPPTNSYDFGLITEEETCPYKIPMTPKKWRNKVWAELQENSKREAELLIESLKIAMNTSTFNNDNW